MKRAIVWILAVALVCLAFGPAVSMAATEQAKQQAIEEGLAWLAGTQAGGGYWEYGPTRYDIAATGSAALAFIEEGFLPGADVIIDTGGGPVNYGDVVGKACNYLFGQAQVHNLGWEMQSSGPRTSLTDTYYMHHAEDYNFDNVLNDGGNGQAVYFGSTDVYSNGIVAPVVYALGQKLGKNTVVGMGSGAVSAKTYAQVMQDVVDWFSWGQVEPNRSQYRGGWRYNPNYSSSDNSTAQWGALPLLYGQSWGLGTPQFVYDELDQWTSYIQNANGGSGYDHPNSYVNVSKTGGLMLEFGALGKLVGDANVQAARNFIDGRWNNGPSSTWYGNLNHPYAMWAVYKGLEVYGYMSVHDNGTPGDTSDDFLIGWGMPNAPGGFTIGQDWDPKTSLAGDWYSHYSDYLVNIQNADGSWNGYSSWSGPLATGWYINILNATGAPEPVFVIPEPSTLIIWSLLGALGISVAWWRRRRKAA